LQSIEVNLPQAGYEIRVAAGLFENLESHLQSAGLEPPFLIVSQPRIFKVLGRSLTRKFPVVMIPDGERAKTLATVSRLLDRMVGLKLTRQSTVIALGGGVVGDVAGFVASIYMRGIPVVHVPTTLLAQVDSSIGGKTGVNHRVAKNLIGTFYQPRLVLSDPLLLRPLPEREYLSGLYESLKYGIIRDTVLFAEFETNISPLLERDPDAVERLVARCARIKADVVMADEKEADLRRILNFGHTVGHALEAAARYQRIRHGEAVGYGMIAAARLSEHLNKLSMGDRRRIENTTHSIGRLPFLDGVKSRSVLNALQRDKKVRDGAPHFVLPLGIGRVEITPDVPFSLVRDVVREILDEAKKK
jgi:3-dehydroquinate synthase